VFECMQHASLAGGVLHATCTPARVRSCSRELGDAHAYMPTYMPTCLHAYMPKSLSFATHMPGPEHQKACARAPTRHVPAHPSMHSRVHGREMQEALSPKTETYDPLSSKRQRASPPLPSSSPPSHSLQTPSVTHKT
jgi:hypothetical protein